MSDEANNLADVPELDATLPVDDGQNDQPTLDEYGNPVEPEPVDDSEEIEHEGQKYRIPKALKDGFLMQSDYTRKTQALAADRQAFEARQAEFGKLSDAEFNARAHAISIDNALKEYAEIDWRKFFEIDPARAQAAKLDYDDLKEKKQQAINAYGQAHQARLTQEQQDTATRMREGHAELVRDIPGWNQEKATALMDFGTKQFGFSREEMAAIDDPRAIKVLNAAFEFVKSSAQQKATQEAQAKQAVRPAAKVNGGASPSGRLDDRTSTDAWMKQRQAQLAKR